MEKPFKIIITLVLLLVLFSNFQAAPAAQPWRDKIDPWVLEQAAEGEAEFLVYMNEQADLKRAASLQTKLGKGTYVYETLTDLARRTQGPVLQVLKELGVEHRSYWVANMIWVRGGLQVVQAMAVRDEVAHIYANPWVRLAEPILGTPAIHSAPEAIEWSISLVGANQVWAEGFTGQDAVIAGQDTGYDWDHPALKNQYRGWDGSTMDHDYSWHDAIHSGGGSCGADSPEPCDDHGHGTHTMGTMVGNDMDPSDPDWPEGATNAIGMAPGAQWIGCRNMNVGAGTPATYAECYEFFIAPYPIGGDPLTDGDPSKAPHVINNSWACPPSEGCTDPNVLLMVVQNVRAAGIVTVHSAGNSGLACSSIDDPAAIYAESFTVGATNSGDSIASFSSRGPVTVDGSNRQKPDISAPGVGIRSSVRGGGYQGGWSGTSMAAPHVAGLVALLVSAQPALAGQVSEIESVIEGTALPRTTGQGCGGDGLTDVPNNVYGWGRIQAYSAISQIEHDFAIDKTATPGLIAPGQLLTYTLAITHLHMMSPTNNVVLTDTLPAQTNFITATRPHIFDGQTLQWDFPSLMANEMRRVEILVQVPITASGSVTNSDYGVSSDEVGIVRGEPITTEVRIAGVALGIDQTAYILPGEVFTFTHNLTNTGAVSDTFDLTITSALGWSHFDNASVSLESSQSASLIVTTTVPISAALGSVDVVTLTATSQRGPWIFAQVTDRAIVPHRWFLPVLFEP